MEFFPRPSIIFKTLRQLGLRSLSLYALYRVGLKSGHYQRMTQDKGQELALNPRSLVLHLFDLPPREKLLAILGHDGKASLHQEAGEILNGKFRMFGGGPVELKLKGDWPLAHWTEYETGRIKLDGDLKFIWEPARFGWAFTLGRAGLWNSTLLQPGTRRAAGAFHRRACAAHPAHAGLRAFAEQQSPRHRGGRPLHRQPLPAGPSAGSPLAHPRLDLAQPRAP